MDTFGRASKTGPPSNHEILQYLATVRLRNSFIFAQSEDGPDQCLNIIFKMARNFSNSHINNNF